ncbi:MAG: hypothetical protein C4325_06805 [Blastocatellia bacterium]
MDITLDKFRSVIDETIERRFATAADRHSITLADVCDSVCAAIKKHFVNSKTPPEAAEIRHFIEELSADDLCLVIACRRGSESAWDELFRLFQPVVKAIAYRVASNIDAAEELAGSVWGELFGIRSDANGRATGKLAYYSGRGSLGSWLRAVTAQLAIDLHRENSRFVQFAEDRELESAAEISLTQQTIRPTNRNPEEAVLELRAASDVSSAVIAAIKLLEAKDRLILKLYYFDGLTLKEIGQVLDFHEATASRRLARIQAEIRSSTERILQSEFGWNDSEIRNYLAETAERIGPGLEKIVGGILISIIVQGLNLLSVQ